MKKIIVTLVSVFVLGFSLANANPMNAINTSNVSVSSATALSSSDEAMLFGGKANAMVLDNEEMKNTQGEGFFLGLLGAALTPVAVQFGNWIGDKLFR